MTRITFISRRANIDTSDDVKLKQHLTLCRKLLCISILLESDKISWVRHVVMVAADID